jgi:ribosomal-protein-serine acetyltransferase
LFPYHVDHEITLGLLQETDAADIFELLQRNRAHLDPWLRWSGRVKTIEDTTALIRRFQQKHVDGDGFHIGIWKQNKLTGGLVCHYINRESSKTEIGYWLAAEYIGRGLVTRTVQVVIQYLFVVEKMHRIEIQCATDNLPSRAVAERLGFTLEGIKRESEWLTSRYADHYLYSLLAHEWQALK